MTGSDYGERRLILWDASYPKFESPVQLPHIIYWTPEGLIRKILFQKKAPTKHFWMTQKQLGQLDEGELVETWVGENATLDDIASDSDDNAEDDGENDMGEEDTFGMDDVRDEAGAAVAVTGVDKFGAQFAAEEYIAGGGTLVISLQVGWYYASCVYDAAAVAFCTHGRGCMCVEHPTADIRGLRVG